jgi:hypothetical protein
MKYLFLSTSQRPYNQNPEVSASPSLAVTRAPQKEESDISIRDMINKNGKAKKRSIRKMINPQKYVPEKEWRRGGRG